MSYLKIAHRGASAYEPENTLKAFERAIELGSDYIELDVRQTKDGELVVIHDSDIDGTTNGSGLVAKLTLEQIKNYRCDKGEQIPTLQEVIDFVNGRCGLYIELKDKGIEQKVAKHVQRNKPYNNTIIVSFHKDDLKRIKELDSRIKTSMLTSQPYADNINEALKIGADYIHYCYEHLPHPEQFVTNKAIAEAKSNALEIIIWHEERPEMIRKIAQYPVAGICSNKPELL